jgi:hypothetical protein
MNYRVIMPRFEMEFRGLSIVVLEISAIRNPQSEI